MAAHNANANANRQLTSFFSLAFLALLFLLYFFLGGGAASWLALVRALLLAVGSVHATEWKKKT